jgi:erythromycin esterase-like protein
MPVSPVAGIIAFVPADLPNWMRVFRSARNGLERVLAFEPFMDNAPIPDRRACVRSLELLEQCLSPAQRAEFARSSTFRVRGQSGQQYRITYGTTSNVEVLEPAGTVSRRLCALPAGNLPIPAVMLAQKLMLETQEAEFLRIAAQGPGTHTVALRR